MTVLELELLALMIAVERDEGDGIETPALELVSATLEGVTGREELKLEAVLLELEVDPDGSIESDGVLGELDRDGVDEETPLAVLELPAPGLAEELYTADGVVCNVGIAGVDEARHAVNDRCLLP